MSLAKLTSTYSDAQTLHVRLLLERDDIPFMTRNEGLQHLMGIGALGGTNRVAGPVEFWVPQGLMDIALAAIADSFEIFTDNLPAHCPACGQANQPPLPECRHCGLFLG